MIIITCKPHATVRPTAYEGRHFVHITLPACIAQLHPKQAT